MIDPVRLGKTLGDAVRREPGLRRLINLASVVALAWIGYVVWAAFAERGLFHAVAQLEASTSPSGSYHPVGVLAACLLAGLLPLIFLTWLLWRLFLRRRPA